MLNNTPFASLPLRELMIVEKYINGTKIIIISVRVASIHIRGRSVTFLSYEKNNRGIWNLNISYISLLYLSYNSYNE